MKPDFLPLQKPNGKPLRRYADLGLDSRVCGLARSKKEDVDVCLDCDVDMVHVFIPTSEVQRTHTIHKSAEEVLDITREIVGYVRDHSDLCMFSAMDATRTDWDYLVKGVPGGSRGGSDGN